MIDLADELFQTSALQYFSLSDEVLDVEVSSKLKDLTSGVSKNRYHVSSLALSRRSIYKTLPNRLLLPHPLHLHFNLPNYVTT